MGSYNIHSRGIAITVMSHGRCSTVHGMCRGNPRNGADITERKQAKRSSVPLALARSLIEASLDPSSPSMLTENHGCQQATEEVTGLSREELIEATSATIH